MAIRNIIKDDNPLLRKKSRLVDNFDEKLHVLLDDMKETLIKAGGVGLAAPQVSILRRAFIIYIDDEDFYLECINPEIVSKRGEQCNLEGCLSVSNRQEEIKRPEEIDVIYYDRFGNKVEETIKGFHTVIFSHEFDHLNGILFYDHVGE